MNNFLHDNWCQKMSANFYVIICLGVFVYAVYEMSLYIF